MKARREAAAGDDGVAPPNGWFERAADWLDGRAPKVGRNNNPDHLASWEDAAGDADDGSASWESLTAVGAGEREHAQRRRRPSERGRGGGGG